MAPLRDTAAESVVKLNSEDLKKLVGEYVEPNCRNFLCTDSCNSLIFAGITFVKYDFCILHHYCRFSFELQQAIRTKFIILYSDA